MTKKLTYKFVKASFDAGGYRLLSRDYRDSSFKLDYICQNNHQHSITWSDWKSGYRCPICAIINRTGSNSSSWKGGISFGPYCEAWKDQEYKQDIRDRDGNRCLNPYCSSPDNTDLTIHHIDYNKKNCKPSNLITVCRSCNSKANTDREWHKAWYQNISLKRGIV